MIVAASFIFPSPVDLKEVLMCLGVVSKKIRHLGYFLTELLSLIAIVDHDHNLLLGRIIQELSKIALNKGFKRQFLDDLFKAHIFESFLRV